MNTSSKSLPNNSDERLNEFLRIVKGLQTRPPTQPGQNPDFFYPGLTAKPWHNAADFEWIQTLENSFQIIRNELFNLGNKKGFVSYMQPETSDNYRQRTDWFQYYFYLQGRKFEENCLQCPETTKLLEAIPKRTGVACFSALSPNTIIEPHCGPTNARIKCHLGLKIPLGCSIRVGDETRTWEEGKCFVFDDSFEHEVRINATSSRIALIVDVWHPELTDSEVKALESLEQTEFAQYIQEGWRVVDETKPHILTKDWWRD
ncbi:MAG: aspartyl/asparaginyl beta-hydroxylase domain-containing protein [Desmonostoc geniculatum HA4340-LM1]|jgi:aspartate beta-hydroxylase|nr:aspartyl/asparaginyl beta-hydroxylase domain-containing protein [Desmonostoc geniculatum HA4340-LM1]